MAPAVRHGLPCRSSRSALTGASRCVEPSALGPGLPDRHRSGRAAGGFDRGRPSRGPRAPFPHPEGRLAEPPVRPPLPIGGAADRPLPGALLRGVQEIYDVTLYEVRPNGQLRALHAVPDPQHFYSAIRTEDHPFWNSRLMRFHPSWRFAYAVSDVERAYPAVALESGYRQALRLSAALSKATRSMGCRRRCLRPSRIDTSFSPCRGCSEGCSAGGESC